MNTNASTTQNSKVIVFFAPRGAGDPHRQKARRPMPRLHFSEALANCRAEGDIVSSLCRISGLPFGFLPLLRTWPWLKQAVEAPCRCDVLHPSALLVLCHLFDRHVVDLKDWSMQQLVEWGTRTQDTFDSPAR